MSRSVWGYVNDASSSPIAVYYVHWTLGRSDHGANFDLIVGSWGEATGPTDRLGVSLVYHQEHQSFMVVDAAQRPFSKEQDLFSRALPREEVMGTDLAPRVFAMVDAIWLGDSRIAEVRGGS